VDSYPFSVGYRAGSLMIALFTADFLHTLYEKKKDSLPASLGEVREGIRALIYGRS